MSPLMDNIFEYPYELLTKAQPPRDVTVWDFTVRYGDGVSTVYHGIFLVLGAMK